VEVEALDPLLARLAPGVTLAGGERLSFAALDDFHPERLLSAVPALARLAGLRRRLADPRSFAGAAAELGQAPGEPGQAKPESDADALARLLGGPPEHRAGTPAARAIDALVKGLVAPHVAPAADPHLEVYLHVVDERLGAELRAVLHHPPLQALEARWRALHLLASGVETDEDLSIHLLDLTRAEIEAGVAGDDIGRSGLYRCLGADIPGEAPWSLIVTDLSFGPSATDLTLLAGLGAVAAATGAVLLAGARPALLGVESLARTPDPADWPGPGGVDAARWQALRTSALAPHIGLALPRLLLRLPYGRSGEALDVLAFEELGAEPAHEDYLWGNAAFGVALALAREFREQGWAMAATTAELEDLPAYSHREAGESRLQPCAEVVLGERAAQAILERGLIPMLSYRTRNAVRLPRLRSVADPGAPLAGPWA
jgi:type VI secretion system protein ImpC